MGRIVGEDPNGKCGLSITANVKVVCGDGIEMKSVDLFYLLPPEIPANIFSKVSAKMLCSSCGRILNIDESIIKNANIVLIPADFPDQFIIANYGLILCKNFARSFIEKNTSNKLDEVNFLRITREWSIFHVSRYLNISERTEIAESGMCSMCNMYRHVSWSGPVEFAVCGDIDPWAIYATSYPFGSVPNQLQQIFFGSRIAGEFRNKMKYGEIVRAIFQISKNEC